MLLPLPKPRLLQLDLLREPLPQPLLLLLKLRVVYLPHLGLPKLTRLHLSLAIRLVVTFFGRVDQVEHVRSDKERPELAEVAVGLVVDW